MSENLIVGPADIALILGVSARSIARYRGLGLPCHGHGKYDIPSAVAWYVMYREKKARDAETIKNDRRNKPSDEQKAKTADERLTEARARKIEMENDLLEKNIYELEYIKGLFGNFCTTTANYFEALGARIAPIVSTMDDPALIEAEIRKESRKIRELFANKLAKAEIYEICDSDN